MKEKLIKIMISIMIIVSVTIGMGMFVKSDTCDKYMLVTIAAVQGAKHIQVSSDSVEFLLDHSYITYYDYGYGINELTSK